MSNRNFVVGVFVFAGLALFSIGIFLVGDRHGAFSKHVEYYTQFTNLNGLTLGSKVKVAGMDAGQIVEIGIPASPSSAFRIKLQISEQLRGLVRNDSQVAIATEGVVGGTYLLVRPGSPQSLAAAPLTVLASQEPVDMSKLLERGMGLIKDADATVNQVGDKLSGALDNVTETVTNVNDLVVGLKRGKGAAGMLLRDETVATDIKQAVANAQQATADFRHASNQADSLVSDLRSRHLTQNIDETISTAKNIVTSLNESVQQIHQTIAVAAGDDKYGVDGGSNISESLSNLNLATANMAEGTEAFKHNFLVRGFFRRRGYYNLAHVSPADYRRNKSFSDPSNSRVWLASKELFQQDTNGSEVLSPGGKHLLDTAIAGLGESIVNRPIVIEGYSNRENSGDRVAYSQTRAILVRQYLRDRFQLQTSDLDVIALGSEPPEGVQHSQWDGVSLVVLKQN